ncbi:hypothetical protein [Actinoplanes teichomyceticus]|uniref:Uncharacterized protein n=1 Tax=Actinoplanes teichomyceticus TaxID=1867 RepID=A0A561WAR2_ACTTI|nr:hypothetical protein [Actinoplanes teichomyceticus]TWG20949.1 hypothetical protein FHX34_103478 [Actinoplanes teichomyceticus]GIF16535.1 hypothetical protein Ate01nite_65670 [Actinoplanes teichomyceticus]
MKPTVGRIVHYVSYGTPGGEYTSQCRAAVVTEVNGPAFNPATGRDAEDSTVVGLCVLNPEGMFFNRSVLQSEPAETPGDPNCPDRAEHGKIFRYCACGWLPATPRGGTWHWPERE